MFRVDGTFAELILAANGGGVAPLDEPTGLAVGPESELFVSGRASDNIFRVGRDGAVTLVMSAVGDGLGAGLDGPGQLAVDATGVLYVPSENTDSLFEVHFTGPDNAPGAQVDEIRRAVSITGDGVEGLMGPRHATDAPGRGVYFAGSESDNVFFYRPFEPVPEPRSWTLGLAAVFTLLGLRAVRPTGSLHARGRRTFTPLRSHS